MNISLPGRAAKRTIGLAPLIDIVFILLIFFVLESTLTVFNEVSVNFPEAKESSSQSSSGSGLSVQVFGRDKLWVAGQRMNLDQFRLHLKNESYNASIPVRLELSAEAPVQAAIFVLDSLNNHGMSNISLGRVKQ